MVFGRKQRVGQDALPGQAITTDKAVYAAPTDAQVRRATSRRRSWALLTSFFLLIALVFTILVEIGNVRSSSSILNSIYFFKVDLSNVVPLSVPNAVLINSIARTLGLHDFYTVGLWNYCEGYNNEGVTDCLSPQTLYWFNPVEIIQSQLLAGASINLPSELTDILSLIETVSHWMFGLFLTGACLTFVMIFIVPLSVYSRWASFPIAIFTFLNALFITVAAVIATVMFIIMRNVFNDATELNINAEVGTKMFAFMWVAAAFSIFAWLIQMGQLCCCASRRDVRTGRKGQLIEQPVAVEQAPRRRRFFSRH